MTKVILVQADNRANLEYLLLTQKINKQFCDKLGYEYKFIEIDNNKYGNIHPATKKIHIVNDFLNSTDCDAVIFLDSDAWIVDGSKTKLIVNNLLNNEKKNGCFSRDPYVKKNTYINSGSFIIKNNTYIKKMYTNILQDLNENDHYHKRWPYDQYYVSKEIVEHREDFVIFVPDILNTPIGKVFRHNWLKNGRMWDQLKREPNLNIIDNPDFVEENYYDNECYPNKKASGYEYFH